MSNTERTITLFESQYDNHFITGNNWEWQVAKSVATGNASAVANLVWQSQAMAPTMSVSWDVVYALNWTAVVPTVGKRVAIGGSWQECAKGEIYDLGSDGYWAPSSGDPLPGWMKVGTINYKYPNVQGIHIIVGVKNTATGQYDSIFCDSTTLPPGSSAQYQPQEKISWWFQGSNLTGQVFSQTQGAVGGVDASMPASSTNQYAWWTTYTSDDGKWANSQTQPPQSLMSPPLSEALWTTEEPVEIILFPIVQYAVLAAAIGVASQPKVRDYILQLISNTFTKVEVIFTTKDGNELRVTYGPPKSAKEGTMNYMGAIVGEGDDAGPIDAALRSAATNHLLPEGETWKIQNNE